MLNCCSKKKEYDRAAVQYTAAIVMSTQPREASEAMLGLILARSFAQGKLVRPSKTELDNLNLTVWPGPLVGYVSGIISDKKLLAILQASDDDDAQSKLTQLLYYLGQFSVLFGDDAQAKSCFLAVMTLNHPHMVETTLAKKAFKTID